MYNFDVNNIRRDFPILNQKINDQPLIYLDSGATAHKPNIVLEEIKKYYEIKNANPHRGAYQLSVLSTEVYENTRELVRGFINAKSTKEIIFTKNTTESLNLIAFSYGMNFIKEGDEIVLLIANHHSNIVPWQQVAKTKRAHLKYMYLDDEGRLTEDEMKEKISPKTKLVSLCDVSNVLGTVYPVKSVIDYAHKMGAIVVVDGAQGLPHRKVDVTELDADFYAFSAHKMLGPMGFGVLYGKEELLNEMPPFLTGGNMIEYVSEEETTFAELPYKFEAGTQNVSGAAGLAAAINYLNEIGMDNITAYEKDLTAYALNKLLEIDYLKIYGPKTMKDRGGVISFTVEGAHPHDVASILDAYGVAIRSGHHCARPLMNFLGVAATSRASFYFYNTFEEIDVFVDSIKKVRKWLGSGS
ncbi:cysteine desulfurase [Alkaliphilus transvaalensis]|uniref:cysteine desulfurase n=1 Tax=Alkaliphilus transvaalensis TaxID=114628 RepID=UPI00047E3619|nr:cysteine desulfurase [Alkaliphilus transvaalensis]